MVCKIKAEPILYKVHPGGYFFRDTISLDEIDTLSCAKMVRFQPRIVSSTPFGIHQKYSRLRCLLGVKFLVIFFIWAGLAVFFDSEKYNEGRFKAMDTLIRRES